MKHLFLLACTLDYKELERYTYTVLDVGACNENNLKNVWKSEGCTIYHTMDIKPSDWKGNFLSPNVWNDLEKNNDLKKYDIITFLECIDYILFKKDLYFLFEKFFLYLKDNGRCFILLEKTKDFDEKDLQHISELGLTVSLKCSLSTILVFIGIDSEKINPTREFEWNLFYLNILKKYSTEEDGLDANDWNIASKYYIYIFEKKKSKEIINLKKNIQIYFL